MIIKINNENVEIDDNLVDVVINLNNKGYQTKECCEGHIPLFYTYILFWDNDIKNYPEGFSVEIRNNRLLLFKTSKDEEEKMKTLKVLKDWSLDLKNKKLD